MALYGLSKQSFNGGITSFYRPCWLGIKASSTTKSSLLEFTFNNVSTGGASSWALSRSPTVLVPLDPVNFISEEFPDEVSETTMATLWTTQPTFPTVPTTAFRRCSWPNSSPNSIIWSWPRGLKISENESLIFWGTVNGGEINNFSAEIDE